ncbi:MAG: DUF3426 domain-containing protein [Bacillota bacterium]|nr:DUF3426 domain-containing protein [Bacillota bacterium]
MRKLKNLMKKWWFWVIVVLIIGAIGSVSSQKEKVSQTSQNIQPTSTVAQAAAKPNGTSKKAVEKADLEVLESSIKNDSNLSYIVGKIRNNTDKQYKYAQVEINLYDKAGTQVGSTMANVNNLESGAIWSFKALIASENVATYKIKDVTGW